MTGDLEMLERQLAARPFPQLEVISRRFLRRDHYTVLPEAFSEGLQALYPGENGTARGIRRGPRQTG
jgi:hypothetical protein